MTIVKEDHFPKGPEANFETFSCNANGILEALLLEATDCIAVKDLAGRYLLINPAGERYVGYAAQDIIGKTDFELFATETALKIRETDEQVMASGQTQIIEDLLAPLNGDQRYFQAMKCVYRSSTGEVQGVINVVRDTTQRKLAEIALQQANHDLDQFASVVSHDLQAPLRKINYFIGALEDILTNLPEEGRDYMSRIHRTSQKMQSLITDMLNLSRVKRHTPTYGKISLKALVEEAIHEVSEQQSSLKRVFETEGIDLELEADALQIRQLLINLFGNALKFQAPGASPRIQVKALITPLNRCQLLVQDNGIGFDEKHLSQIFKAFERLHGSNAYPGNGMGLAICSRIVERHKGCIQVKSNPGEGSTFLVELPMTQT